MLSPESFSYWLQGYFEISNSNELTPQQVQIIKDHLQEVFHKVTPNRNDGNFGIHPVKFCNSTNNWFPVTTGIIPAQINATIPIISC
jgi:hypothetical protein